MAVVTGRDGCSGAEPVMHRRPETLVYQQAVPARMARAAFVGGTAGMTGVTVLRAPTNRMRVNMILRACHSGMTLRTPLADRIMAIVAVRREPPRRMWIRMTSRTMAN